jgi:superfamily I DNA and/or RNA helicase
MDLLETIDQVAASREKPSVGVITFYTAQRKLLKTKVKELDLQNLDFSVNENIATLDSFQGREEDIIILNLVRRPENAKNIDSKLYRFFLDVRRLNVALSRARKRLFIVGDLERISAVQSTTKEIPGMQVARDLYSFVQQL